MEANANQQALLVSDYWFYQCLATRNRYFPKIINANSTPNGNHVLILAVYVLISTVLSLRPVRRQSLRRLNIGMCGRWVSVRNWTTACRIEHTETYMYNRDQVRCLHIVLDSFWRGITAWGCTSREGLDVHGWKQSPLSRSPWVHPQSTYLLDLPGTVSLSELSLENGHMLLWLSLPFRYDSASNIGTIGRWTKLDCRCSCCCSWRSRISWVPTDP